MKFTNGPIYHDLWYYFITQYDFKLNDNFIKINSLHWKDKNIIELRGDNYSATININPNHKDYRSGEFHKL